MVRRSTRVRMVVSMRRRTEAVSASGAVTLIGGQDVDADRSRGSYQRPTCRGPRRAERDVGRVERHGRNRLTRETEWSLPVVAGDDGDSGAKMPEGTA